MKKKKTESGKSINRRDFIRNSVLLGAGLASAPFAQAHSKDTGSQKKQANSENRMLGDLEVFPIGLGCMSMSSGSYKPSRSKEEMIPVIRGAVDNGVTFFDTVEFYGPFTNEELVGEALAPVRDDVVIATKFGFQFDNGRPSGRNSKPENIRRVADEMLQRLQTDYIDLLYCHRIDPEVPIKDVAGTVKDLIDEGKVLHFGLSEMAPDTVRRAHAVQPVAALQTQYSLLERFPENQILDTCEELGIGFVPWGPVTRGFFGDKFNEWSRFSDGRHSEVASFRPEAIETNMAILNLTRDWGMRKNATPAQISLAWLLAQKPFIVPIPGTTKLHHLEEDLGALNVEFTTEELQEFREDFEAIELAGVRSFESALEDQ